MTATDGRWNPPPLPPAMQRTVDLARLVSDACGNNLTTIARLLEVIDWLRQPTDMVCNKCGRLPQLHAGNECPDAMLVRANGGTMLLMTKPTGRPRGRPPGSKSGPRAEPSVYLALRVPERILGPFRARYERGTAKRIGELMEDDNKRAA